MTPTPLFSIKVRVVGVQTIVDPQKSGGAAEAASSTFFFELEQQCWGSSNASDAQQLSGHMCFSFDIQLPPNLPASFKWLGPNSSSASVEYKVLPVCISTLDGRTEAGVRVHPHPFKLLESLDLPLLMTGTSGSATKKLKFDGSGGVFECSLQLPRALLFTGETIPAVVTIENKSGYAQLPALPHQPHHSPPPPPCSRRIDRLCIVVTQTVTCHTGRGVLTQTTTILEVPLPPPSPCLPRFFQTSVSPHSHRTATTPL